MTADESQLPRWVRAFGMLAFAWVLLRTAWLSDDAFISFRVVENVITGHGLRWNGSERVQVFTHPLWLLLHLPLRALSGEIYYTALAFGSAISLGTVGVLAFRVARSASAGSVAIALALSSKAFVDYSTSGLENPLSHLLAVLFFLLAALPERDTRTLGLQALLAGLLAWNRLDALLVTIPVLAIGIHATGLRRAIRPLTFGFTPFAAWLVFATIYFGHPLPNTAFAKLGAGIGLGELIPLGLRYGLASLRSDPLTLVTIMGALVLSIVRKRHLGISAGIALYLIYTLRVGGDFMGGRFFSLPFVLAIAIWAREMAGVAPRRLMLAAVTVLVFGFLPGSPPLTSGPGYGRESSSLIDAYGIADERAYYFRNAGLWNGTATTTPRDDKWFEATTARSCEFPLVVAGAIGFYGYAAGPDVHILDYNALADPVLARLPAVTADPLYVDWYRRLEGGEPATQRRIGHFLRNVPRGYIAFLLGDPTRFESAELRTAIESIATATRDSLWSSDRISAAVDLATGSTTRSLQRSIDTDRARQFQRIPINEIFLVRGTDGYTRTLRGCGVSTSDPAAAVTLLRDALTTCPENGLAWRCLAEASSRLNLTAESLEARRHVARLAADSDWAHVELGRALRQSGLNTEAREAFARALSLNSWNDEARRGAAVAD